MTHLLKTEKFIRDWVTEAYKFPEIVSEEVNQKVSFCMMDFLAGLFDSLYLNQSQQIIQVCAIESAGDVLVPGLPHLMTRPASALVAGTVGHGLLQEDMHVESTCHIGVVIFPCLFALAQKNKVSGRKFLQSVNLGYQAMAKLGMVIVTPENSRSFRPLGLAGPVGASLAAAYMLDLTVDQACNAVNIASNTAAGLNRWPIDGGAEVYLHAGLAAQNAVLSVLLARQGFLASAGALMGTAGLVDGYSKQTATPTILSLSGKPEILSVYHKPAPACNYAQTPAQVALKIVNEHKEKIKPQLISRVNIRSFQSAIEYPGCNSTGPFTHILQAQMSIQFSVVSTLVKRSMNFENFDDLSHPDIVSLLDKTTLENDQRLQAKFPSKQGVSIEVTLSSGEVINSFAEDLIPLTTSEVRHRFQKAAAHALGESQMLHLEEIISNLASVEYIDTLLMASIPTLLDGKERISVS